jgi:hypothetical protein
MWYISKLIKFIKFREVCDEKSVSSHVANVITRLSYELTQLVRYAVRFLTTQ